MSKQYYEFDDERRAITFDRHDMPSAWINYISNGNLHGFVSQAGGGFVWWKSPTIFRLTRYRVHNLPLDTPGFYVYIRQSDGTIWSPSFRPCETPLDQWSSEHQPGITHFRARKGDIGAQLSLYIAPDHDSMVWELSLSNAGSKTVKLDVFAYTELSIHEWIREVSYSYYNKHQLKVWHDKDLDALLYLYHADGLPRPELAPLVYFAADSAVDSFCGDRDGFVGNYRSERDPVQVEQGRLSNAELIGGEPCAAVHQAIELAPGATVKRTYFLGATSGAIEDFGKARKSAGETLAALRKPGAVQTQHDKLTDWWENHLGRYQCTVPVAEIQRQINTWNPVQSVHTGRYSRSISSQATGRRGVGYRDTATDMIAIAYRDPEWAKREFCYLLSLQLPEGYAAHQSWPVDNEPVELSIRCDDHLWLPFVANAIVAETGDISFLNEEIEYFTLEGKTPQKATVLQHLMQGFAFTESHLGAHGLPLTLRGDWNDIIAKFTYVQKGESVFAGQQYVVALRYTTELARALGDEDAATRCEMLGAKQARALADSAWDGQWWIRAFDDDGSPIGSNSAEWGKIWLNPQSWAVISGAGPIERLREGMDNAEKQLNTEMGIQLLAPSYKTYPDVKKPFSGYNEGAGENGSIFCQSNTWTIIAEALLGNADRAWKYYLQLLPHLALQRAGIQRYRAEPYAYVSNIVGPDNPQFGWANVNQVTGTVAWMDVASTQYLLGVRPQVAGLRVDPCIPKAWKSFTVNRLYRGTRLEIVIDNSAGVQKGVTAIAVDGTSVDIDATGGPVIPPDMVAGKDQARVEVTMGEVEDSVVVCTQAAAAHSPAHTDQAG